MRTHQRWLGRGLAWAGLVGSSVMLALLLTRALAGGVDSRVHTAPTPVLSPATAALADGDDVRSRFLASIRGQGLDVTSDPSLSH